ncbi:hypothetical protein JGU66_25655 [Myxococcaceae bacterium JPH2]|nr:hypothetical protein [Myxococcaceae bacterium JPH2]
MTAWYNSLVRWLKANFKNSCVSASDFKPEVGSREHRVWVGPHAIERSRRGCKLKQSGPLEFSLHYFDPADEDQVLARYREPKNLLLVGRVTHAGEVVDPTLRKQVFRVEMENGAPLPSFEGPFMSSHPEPKPGDEVACVFNENILGRHPEPWESRELKRLPPKNRERILQGLRKTWRL